MILIFGGAYQGKEEFARGAFDIREEEICRLDRGMKELPAGFRCYSLFHEFTLGMVERGEDVLTELGRILPRLSAAVVVADDISQGLVPMDRKERLWREENGRALIRLAAEADEVWRVFCGLGTRVK